MPCSCSPKPGGQMPPWCCCQSAGLLSLNTPSSATRPRQPCRNACRKCNGPWGLSILSLDSRLRAKHNCPPHKVDTGLLKETWCVRKHLHFSNTAPSAGWGPTTGDRGKEIHQHQHQWEIEHSKCNIYQYGSLNNNSYNDNWNRKKTQPQQNDNNNNRTDLQDLVMSTDTGQDIVKGYDLLKMSADNQQGCSTNDQRRKMRWNHGYPKMNTKQFTSEYFIA